MKIYGLPREFWMVTKPSFTSELAEICFACTVEGLMRRARGGLKEDETFGIYADKTTARKAAARLLGGHAVRPQDALAVEVVVHVMVMPAEEMVARELAEAAVEAVANAVRDAERRGHQHRLEGQVTLGMSEVVELHKQLTAIG